MNEEEKVEIKKDIWRADKDDMVNHPSHYTSGKVECIDAIEASMTPEEFAGFLKGNTIKYIWRFEKKWDPVEDLKKAEFYLDRLIRHVEANCDIWREKQITLNYPEINDEDLDNLNSVLSAIRNSQKSQGI